MTNKAWNHIWRIIKWPTAAQTQQMIDLLQKILDQNPDEAALVPIWTDTNWMPVFLEKLWDADAWTFTTSVVDFNWAVYTWTVYPNEINDLLQLEPAWCVCITATKTTLKRWQLFKDLWQPTQQWMAIIYTDSISWSIVANPAAGTYTEGTCDLAAKPTSIGHETYTTWKLTPTTGTVYAVWTVIEWTLWFRLDWTAPVIWDSHRAAAGQYIYLQIEDEILDFEGLWDPSAKVYWTYYDKPLLLT